MAAVWQRCGVVAVVVVWKRCSGVVVVWWRYRGSAVVDRITVVFSRQCSRWWRCCSRLGLVLHTSACPASLDAFRTQIQVTSQQEQDTHRHRPKNHSKKQDRPSRTHPDTSSCHFLSEHPVSYPQSHSARWSFKSFITQACLLCHITTNRTVGPEELQEQ